jgi:hypothetical protein
MKLFATFCLVLVSADDGPRAGAINTPGLNAQGYWPWIFGGSGIWKPVDKPVEPKAPTTWGCWAGYGQCENFTNPRTKQVRRVRWRQAACLDQTECNFPLKENIAVSDEEFENGACENIVETEAPQFCVHD